MEINSEVFDEDAIERNFVGAGVVPIAIDAHGMLHLLLGRERWISHWKGSCRWSGFEGTRKPPETVVQSASREFVEESMAITCMTNDADTTCTPQCAVESQLLNGQFWKRIVLRIDNDRRIPRYHCTYVLPVAWNNNIPERFQHIRAIIEHIDRLTQEWKYTRPACLGRTCIHVGALTHHEDGSAHVEVAVGGELREYDIPTRSVNDLTTWFAMRDRLDRALIAHPCVHVTRDARWGHVQDVTIHRDHLEKDQVRWWSVTDLREVLLQYGQLGPDRFRPYFLPVLQTILTQVDGVLSLPTAPASAPPAP